jgi:hypothetical protein
MAASVSIHEGVRGFGSMESEIHIAEGFDEPLEEFAEYEKR